MVRARASRKQAGAVVVALVDSLGLLAFDALCLVRRPCKTCCHQVPGLSDIEMLVLTAETHHIDSAFALFHNLSRVPEFSERGKSPFSCQLNKASGRCLGAFPVIRGVVNSCIMLKRLFFDSGSDSMATHHGSPYRLYTNFLIVCTRDFLIACARPFWLHLA